MPIGKNGALPPRSDGQEQPVVFQKSFTSGPKTYAAQIKVSGSGRKYLLLSEGSRNPETREVKHHSIRVHEHEMKAFFSMLQETVVYLRAAKSLGNTMTGVVATGSAQPATPASATSTRVAKSAAKSPSAAKPLHRTSAKPPVIEVAKPTKTTSCRVPRPR